MDLGFCHCHLGHAGALFCFFIHLVTQQFIFEDKYSSTKQTNISRAQIINHRHISLTIAGTLITNSSNSLQNLNWKFEIQIAARQTKSVTKTSRITYNTTFIRHQHQFLDFGEKLQTDSIKNMNITQWY